MKKSTKAALLSAIVYPGAGLFWLKRYGRALVFMLPATLAIIYILKVSLHIAHQLADKLAHMDLFTLDTDRLLALVHQALTQPQLYLEQTKWIFLICWVLSIASSYSVGKQMEAREH